MVNTRGPRVIVVDVVVAAALVLSFASLMMSERFSEGPTANPTMRALDEEWCAKPFTDHGKFAVLPCEPKQKISMIQRIHEGTGLSDKSNVRLCNRCF